MIYTAEQLSARHPEYSSRANRWKFYHDSFNGGEYYSSGQYLTRYVYESNDDYAKRITQTPYDNHCRSVIDIYNSFLFGNEIKRELEDLVNDPSMMMFLEDADFEGRNFTDFMKEAHSIAATFGSSWILVEKPEFQAETRAQEIAMALRPYVSLISPLNVVNWNYTRTPMGWYELTYLQVIEQVVNDVVTYRIYTKESTDTVTVTTNGKNVTLTSSIPQVLGYVPSVCLYATRSAVKGIGISDISDIADINRAMYDEMSEIEQLIRLSNHPSLVKTSETQASAGAGSIITLPDNIDPGLVPFLLQPDSQSLEGIRAAIEDKIASIDRIAHIGSVRSTQTRTISGTALDSEFRLLNSKLSGRAKGLELAEEQILEIWCDWQGVRWNGLIEYPDTFNTKDKNRELALLQQAKEILNLPRVVEEELEKEIRMKVVNFIFDDIEEIEELSMAIEMFNLDVENSTLDDAGDIVIDTPDTTDNEITDSNQV